MSAPPTSKWPKVLPALTPEQQEAFVEKEPATTWRMANSREYGFYSNVNPQVDHPRWSQASERRIGDFTKRPTLPFNGYADQVAGLYTGMDLAKNF